MINFRLYLTVSLILLSSALRAQDTTFRNPPPLDSVVRTADSTFAGQARVDSVRRVYSPRAAAIRSAILPGLGQAYNRRYWKIPIVYGALGTAGVVLNYNLKNYRDLRFAYRAKVLAQPPPNGRNDTTLLDEIEPRLFPLDISSLRQFRDEFRRNIDYNILVIILIWGLNVADAAVDAHLKGFDVSPDLSLRFKPGYSDIARTNGLSLQLRFK